LIRFPPLSLSVAVMGLLSYGAQPALAESSTIAEPGPASAGVEQTVASELMAAPASVAVVAPAMVVANQPPLTLAVSPPEPSSVPIDPALEQGQYVTQASALVNLNATSVEPEAPNLGGVGMDGATTMLPASVWFTAPVTANGGDNPIAAIQSGALSLDLGFAPSGAEEAENTTLGQWLAQTDDNPGATEGNSPLKLPAGDPELGVIRVRSALEDPELGILRIREQPPIPIAQPQEPRKIGFFTARLSGASSDNILLVEDDLGGLTGDEYLRPGVSFSIYPALGPQTLLIGSADISFQRYLHESAVNYDDLRFRLGIRQGVFPRTYMQLMFTYQQLFRPGPPRLRFFENTSLGLTIGRRDPLTSRLVLNTYYQVQFNDSEVRPSTTSPTDSSSFDRLSQYFGGYLGYYISNQFETGISYQATLADYTGVERYDAYHQLLGQFVYNLTPSVRMSIFGGWSFGRSSRPDINFNDTLFGFTIDATVGLF
jgi:hypothetical protein